jgi:hypothetical protein
MSNINVKNTKFQLDNLSWGDLLMFADREEKVISIVKKGGGFRTDLYTERIGKTCPGNLSPRKEFIIYENVGEITPFLQGKVYAWTNGGLI